MYVWYVYDVYAWITGVRRCMYGYKGRIKGGKGYNMIGPARTSFPFPSQSGHEVHPLSRYIVSGRLGVFKGRL